MWPVVTGDVDGVGGEPLVACLSGCVQLPKTCVLEAFPFSPGPGSMVSRFPDAGQLAYPGFGVVRLEDYATGCWEWLVG